MYLLPVHRFCPHRDRSLTVRRVRTVVWPPFSQWRPWGSDDPGASPN
jgi:hypothetical protein